MTLQASGTISFDNISVELGSSGSVGTQLSLNSTKPRSLAGAATGSVSMNQYYGRNYDIRGQQTFTTLGLTTWVCPTNVYFIHAVCIGGGGGGAGSGAGGPGGGGGGLGWKNQIPVIPGRSYRVYVGRGGNPNSLIDGVGSFFIPTSQAVTITTVVLASNVATITCSSAHGYVVGQRVTVNCSYKEFNGTYTITVVPGSTTFRYNKTTAAVASIAVTGIAFAGSPVVAGGGGDSGYTTTGGPVNPPDTCYGGGFIGDGGGKGRTVTGRDASTAGPGGGAGGYDGTGGSQTGGSGGNGAASNYRGGGGGGVGLNGEGASGANVPSYGGGGYGGSGGTRGGTHDCSTAACGQGGLYGGGGGGHDSYSAGTGRQGGVRLIWGESRRFPATQTADVTAGEFYT